MTLNRSDIVFKFLIAHKGVVFSAKFSVCTPPLACDTFVTLPAEFDTLLLYCTCYEWTPSAHSGFTLTSATLAYAFCVIGRTKSARQTTNSDFRIFDFHFYVLSSVGRLTVCVCISTLSGCPLVGSKKFENGQLLLLTAKSKKRAESQPSGPCCVRQHLASGSTNYELPTTRTTPDSCLLLVKHLPAHHLIKHLAE